MSARDEIQSRIRNMVHAVLTDEGGSTALVHRTLDGDLADPDQWAIPSYPEPGPDHLLMAADVAGQIERVARGMVLQYAAKARGAGRTWLELADVLDVDRESEDRAHDAFLLVAGKPSMPYDPIYASWKCTSCRMTIRDNGPWSGHPEDAESGHSTGCARHFNEIKAYENRWED